MLDAERDEDIPTVNKRQLREFSLAWLVFFCALGTWHWFGDGDVTALLTFGAIGCSVGLAGLLRPLTIKPLFLLATAMALPIGWVMNRLVLGLLFFGLFTPVGWLFRRLRRDSLRLRKPHIDSYWSPVRSSGDAQSYFRQSL